MDPDAFDTFNRCYAERCVLAGVEPRTREYAAAMVAGWERILRTPACLLVPPPHPITKQ